MLTLRALFKPVGTPGPPSAGLVPPEEIRLGPFGVQPSNRWVTEVFTGETASSTIDLINHGAAPIHVVKLKPGGSDFTIHLEVVEDGKRYHLAVATNPALRTGRHIQTATLLTDSREMPEIPIELEATVRSRVFATPTSLDLPGLSLEASGPQLSLGTIYVRKVGEAGLRIDSVSSTLPFLQSEVTTQTEGQLYAIRITVDKSKVTAPSKFRGTIRVKTNDQAVRVIRIPVQGSFS